MKASALHIYGGGNPISKTIPFDSAESNAPEMNFGQYLNNALQKVTDLQKQASDGALQVATGGDVYLHNMMLSYEKANIAMQLTVEVRNKVVEAYQEIMRMQM